MKPSELRKLPKEARDYILEQGVIIVEQAAIIMKLTKKIEQAKPYGGNLEDK